jgi:hypothetical protein
MKEKYFYIEAGKARALLSQIKGTEAAKRGIDSRVYLIGEYAVLSTQRIKLRNVATRDDDLAYLDELIQTLMSLREQGVAAIPILGYCYDPDSEDGNGYIFQQRAKGDELYDDAVMAKYYVWAQNNPAYLSSDTDARAYILSRTNYLSAAPQKHFDKFISDIIVLLDNDILIDFNGKSNFFYAAAEGFQFIDLDSHTDYKYGLAESKPDSREIARFYGFAPCHAAAGTRVLPFLALEEKALSQLGEADLRQLARDNSAIFEKCKAAMLNNGISEDQVSSSLEILKIFGR